MSDGQAEGDEHTPVGPVALIVTPGARFLSGVSYYTALLTSALAARRPVAMVLLRRPDADGLRRDGKPSQHRSPRPAEPVPLLRTALPLLDKAHADPHSWARNAERYAALLDRIDAAWSGDGRVPGHQAKEVVA